MPIFARMYVDAGAVADVALMHCAVLVTLAVGVLPMAAERLGLTSSTAHSHTESQSEL